MIFKYSPSNMVRDLAASRCPTSRLRLAGAAALIATAAFPYAVCAQTTDDPAAGETGTQVNDGTQLQEIVVTAQRRNENVQRVPISISAFTGDTLKAGGVTTALELGQVDPSVKMNFSVGVAYPFVRGIGNTAAGVVGNESSIAIYVDDFYYTRLFSSILELNSIDRVEILKGPQGTLFGRNATGGAIQIFTKDPGRRTEAEASLGYANYDKITGQVYLSTPVTDSLSWNIAAGASDQRDGWGRSVANGQKEYLGNSWTVRSKLLWEPTITTRIKLTGYYAYQNDDFGQQHDYIKGTVGATTNLGSLDPAPVGYPDPPVIYPSLADSGGFYDSRNVFRTDAKFKTYGATLRVDQEIGFADVVSISGYKRSIGSLDAQVNFLSPTWFKITTGNVDKQITQEIQLKSKASSSINWIVGAFYMHNRAGYNPATFQGDLINFFVVPGGKQEIFGYQTIDSYSVFGQATFPLGEATNLTGGLRYTKDDLKGAGEVFITDPAVGTSQAGPTQRTSHTFRRVTWKAAIDHRLSQDVMVYGSYSRGYKAGTYNTIPLSAEPANPEIVDAYEVGLKSELFGRRVRLNGALFWSDIKDPQVQTVVGTGFSAASGLINAGSARTRGAELSVTAVATSGLELRGNVTYLDAKYTDFTNAPHYEGGVLGGPSSYPILTGATDIGSEAIFPANFDATSYRLPNAPKWSFTVGANYVHDAPIGRMVADVSLSHSSRYNFGVTYTLNDIHQAPVTLLNASLSFTPAALERVTFTAWGKNIGNVQYYAQSEGNVYGFGASGWRGTAAAPRTYGGTITVRY